MHLTDTHLQALCSIAIEAAEKAGTLIYSYHNTSVEVNTKDGGDSRASQVVTEVDLKSQELILDILAPTIASYDLALLTEESEDDKERLEKDYFWCIDPIDGTLPFTEGIPGYAVAISLLSKEGIPQIGVIYDPVYKKLYHAIKGLGAFKNNIPWVVSEKVNEVLTFYYNRSFQSLPSFNEVVKALHDLAKSAGLKGVEIQQAGGAVMNAISAIDNSPSCYFAFPKKAKGGGSFWDYAATSCIYHELGLPATDIYGKPFFFNHPESTFMNQTGVLYASNSAIAEQIQFLSKQFIG